MAKSGLAGWSNRVPPGRMRHTALILDRSGSIDSMAKKAIGGFNSFLKKYQKEACQWQFLFLGADITSTEQSKRFNMRDEDRIQYSCVSEGMSYSSKHISERRREERAKRKKKIGF